LGAGACRQPFAAEFPIARFRGKKQLIQFRESNATVFVAFFGGFGSRPNGESLAGRI